MLFGRIQAFRMGLGFADGYGFLQTGY